MLKTYKCNYCSEEVIIDTEQYVSDEEMQEIMISEELCEDCFDDNYFMCESCYEYHHNNEMNVVTNNRGFENCYCGSCVENNDYIFYCDYHERYEESDNQYKIEDGRVVCREAIECGYFNFCEDCRQWFDSDYVYYHENDGCYYCESCVNYRNELVKEYHEHEDEYEDNMKETYEDKKSNQKLYFGMELEIEANGCCQHDDLASDIQEVTKDVVFEADCSLNAGFEIISYPFTRNYMKNGFEYDLKEMLWKIKNYNYDCSDNCGLHFHVSREAVESEVNLVGLVEYFKEELTIFSRRDEARLNRWSSFYTKDMSKDEITKTKIENLIDDCYSRYHAINLNNYHTIEFRIFKGTTNFTELMATWELVNNFVAYANEVEYDFDNMPSFIDVATYQENKYVESYLESLGLLATC